MTTTTETKEDPEIKKIAAKTRFEAIIMGIGVLLIGANLRAPINSVGPVITEITEQLHLTPVLAGLITTMPLISFALLSVFTPRAARKFGLERILLYSLFILAAGLFTRSTGDVFLLFFGAALIGIAITVGNVLMPALIKKEFPRKVGLVTGVYLVSMNLTSALAAGYSISIGRITGLGWKASIGIWGVIAVITFLFWLPQARKKPDSSASAKSAKAISLWKSRLAWQVSLFMGLQSLMFYCFATWIPAVFQTWGMSLDRSGWMVSYLQMGQVPIMLFGPILAAKMKDQTSLVWVGFILLMAGLAGIIFGKTDYAVISVFLIGISLGLAFTLVMMFFVLRTKKTSEAASLSGMSQSVGYLIAACGPPLFGALYAWTNSWYIPLVMMVVTAIALFITGLASAKDRFV